MLVWINSISSIMDSQLKSGRFNLPRALYHKSYYFSTNCIFVCLLYNIFFVPISLVLRTLHHIQNICAMWSFSFWLLQHWEIAALHSFNVFYADFYEEKREWGHGKGQLKQREKLPCLQSIENLYLKRSPEEYSIKDWSRYISLCLRYSSIRTKLFRQSLHI